MQTYFLTIIDLYAITYIFEKMNAVCIHETWIQKKHYHIEYEMTVRLQMVPSPWRIKRILNISEEWKYGARKYNTIFNYDGQKMNLDKSEHEGVPNINIQLRLLF